MVDSGPAIHLWNSSLYKVMITDVEEPQVFPPKFPCLPKAAYVVGS